MNQNQKDLRQLLTYIDPVTCSYQEWTNVGMALKHEGYSVSDWEDWSARDTKRYHRGECMKKWATFQEQSADLVTGGTIYQMAVDGGYRPEVYEDVALDWDSEISTQGVIVRSGWVEDTEIHEPKVWHPGEEVTKYIETLFEPGEVVGYVMQSRLDKERGKYLPRNKGVFTLTAGEILEKIAKYGDDLGKALGDYDKDAGAWIRFNPLDGHDVRNSNVSEYRYALVESDSLDIEKQNSIIRELELPVAVLMFSGGKSIHAIVRIDATDYKEYQKRVEFLYDICSKNGLQIDTQNKNPSRLSRLPGCQRGDKKQYIIDTNIGKASWTEWKEWVESINDNLPDIEDLSGVWDDMPELADPLIAGVLRKGHKMLIAGPSKAGKSLLLIELTIAIAEGRKWLGRNCSKGRVMYVNLELDRASCLHRFKDVYTSLGWKPENLQNIDIWNLRGKSVPMDILAPKLIRRAQKRNYMAIIIDPIYKVITGDENSAEQMAKFCNQFDKICTELKCAVIYCHHHSKGLQGDKKAADRASGSGVFARDPDAQLDMIELELTKEIREKLENEAVCGVYKSYIDAHFAWEEDLAQDDLLNAKYLATYCENTPRFKSWQKSEVKSQAEAARAKARSITAWRIESTLREFAAFDPINILFDYPIHLKDKDEQLKDITPETRSMSQYKQMLQLRKEKAKVDKAETMNQIIVAFEGLDEGVTEMAVTDLAEEIGVSANTMKKWFGNGKQGRKELQKEFETYINEEDRKLYVRKKNK